MKQEFSANLNHLLKDSLTLQTSAFPRVLAVPFRGDRAIMPRFNPLFTMTALRSGVPAARRRRP
jgi:hypothetical protein